MTSSHTDNIRRHRHAGGVIWITGLSGSGKSTLASTLYEALTKLGYATFVLDGDRMRKGLCADLGFCARDRSENVRRAAEVAALFVDAGLICITAYISPYRADRENARKICGKNFHEFYLSTDLNICESRDPKGLYRRARSGEIPDFTGISSPYEPPEQPDLAIDTASESVDAATHRMLMYIVNRFALDSI